MAVERVEKSYKRVIIASVSAVVVVGLSASLFLFDGLRNGIVTTLKTTVADTLGMSTGSETPAPQPEVVVEASPVENVPSEDVPSGDTTPVVDRKEDNLLIHIPDTIGNFVVLKEGNEAVIIDGGMNKDNAKIKTYLNKIGVSNVKYVIVTNYLPSSYEGIPNLLSYVHSDYIFLSGSIVNSKTTGSLRNHLDKNKIIWSEVNGTIRFKLDKANFELLNTHEDGSIAVLVSNGNSKMLFTSGATRVEQEMVKYLPKLDLHAVTHTDISYRVPNLVLATAPSNIILNDIKGVDAQPAVRGINEAGSVVYQSSQLGDIVVGSNGEDLIFNTEKSVKKK